MPRFRRCRYPGCHAMAKLPDHYCKQHYAHEAEYLANRQRWSRSHHNRLRQHRYNAIARNRNDTKREQYEFYQSRQWQSLRRQVLDRDHYICQYCGQPNSKTVDHVVPIEYNQDLMINIDNLATICRKCHKHKTDWEQRYYGTGQGNDLKQVAEVHDTEEISQLMND